MKCKIVFSEKKNKKINMNVLSAKAQVKVKEKDLSLPKEGLLFKMPITLRQHLHENFSFFIC